MSRPAPGPGRDAPGRAAAQIEARKARVAAFVLGDVAMPERVLARAALLLADTLGVAAGAAELEAGRIARECAVGLFGPPGDGRLAAPLLFDGRVVSLAGAALWISAAWRTMPS